MISNSGWRSWPIAGAGLTALIVPWIIGLAAAADSRDRANASTTANRPRTLSLAAGDRETLELGELAAGDTYSLVVSLESGTLAAADRVRAELIGPGTDRLAKDLHAGDPDFYLPYRPQRQGPAKITLSRAPKAGAAAFLSASSGDRWAFWPPTEPPSRPNPTTRGGRPTSWFWAATSMARPTTLTISTTRTKGKAASTGFASR